MYAPEIKGVPGGCCEGISQILKTVVGVVGFFKYCIVKGDSVSQNIYQADCQV